MPVSYNITLQEIKQSPEKFHKIIFITQQHLASHHCTGITSYHSYNPKLISLQLHLFNKDD